MRWPFTPYGTGPLLAGCVILASAVLVLAWAGAGPWWPLPAALGAFLLWFFRDPERTAAGGEDDLVAPADGHVADIEDVDEPGLGPCTRIGIFLSVFDVHVNRSPCSAEVTEVLRRDGGYHDARDPRAITHNRAATIVLRRPDERRLAVRQITGLIARRIVCPVFPGQPLGRGERYGMIRFGSRTELVVPRSTLDGVLVTVGDKVKGGETLLARMRPGG